MLTARLHFSEMNDMPTRSGRLVSICTRLVLANCSTQVTTGGNKMNYLVSEQVGQVENSY